MTPALIRAANELELVSRWMTPFLRITAGAPKRRILDAFLAPFSGTVPVTVQLMGTDPAAVAASAAALAGPRHPGVQPEFRLPEPSGDVGRRRGRCAARSGRNAADGGGGQGGGAVASAFRQAPDRLERSGGAGDVSAHAGPQRMRRSVFHTFPDGGVAVPPGRRTARTARARRGAGRGGAGRAERRRRYA